MVDQILYLILGVLAAILGWLIFLTVKYRKIMKKAGIIFKGADKEKLSGMLRKYFKDIEEIEDTHEQFKKALSKVKKTSDAGLHKVGLVRYNPFGDVGGNQSFSLCLLNKEDSGFVISSIHSREGTRVYSKPVKSAESTYNLSNEEKKAISVAIKKIEKKKK